MENQNISPKMRSVLNKYNDNTIYFSQVIKGVSNFQTKRVNDIVWLTGSLVQSRFELANLLGVNLYQAANELFRNDQEVKMDIDYPLIVSFLEDWERISVVLKELILDLDHEDLFTVAEETFSKSGTIYDLLSYITTVREPIVFDQIIMLKNAVYGHPN